MVTGSHRILPLTPFAGLGVFFTALDRAEPMQLHLALAEHVDPACGVSSQARSRPRSVWPEFQAPLVSAAIVTSCPPGRSGAEAGPGQRVCGEVEC
jgi:hypothetical protein